MLLSCSRTLENYTSTKTFFKILTGCITTPYPKRILTYSKRQIKNVVKNKHYVKDGMFKKKLLNRTPTTTSTATDDNPWPTDSTRLTSCCLFSMTQVARCRGSRWNYESSTGFFSSLKKSRLALAFPLPGLISGFLPSFFFFVNERLY